VAGVAGEIDARIERHQVACGLSGGRHAREYIL
jgi:hypothetical protein